MKIYNNLLALNASNNFSKISKNTAKFLSKLSTGIRINKAADDAAGLCISEGMRGQFRGSIQAIRNTQDGISLIQTAEGGLNEAHNILQRLRELSVCAANDSLTIKDRQEIQKEINHLKGQLDEIARNTIFNNKRLLDGSTSIVSSSTNDGIKVFANTTVGFTNNIGQIQNIEGEYAIDISGKAGMGQVLSTNILTVKNGTIAKDINILPAGNQYTGLVGIRAQGLAQGDYRIETREIPFGGITYYDSAGVETATPATAFGVNLVDATVSPKIMPYGEYDVNVADVVPFMANFADFADNSVSGPDVIKGVNPTGINNIDVKMDITAGVAATNAATVEAWNDRVGSVTVSTKANYNVNMYTHFMVTDYKARDRLNTDVNAVTYYRSATASTVNMDLTYKAEAASNVQIQVDYRTKNGETIQAQTTYILTGGSQINITVNDAPPQSVIVDVSGMDVEQAKNALEGAINTLNSGVYSTADFTAGVAGGQRSIDFINGTGFSIDISDASGTAAVELGLSGNILSGDTKNGTLLDYNNTHTINVGGKEINDVASIMDNSLAGYGIDVTDINNGDGTHHLRITNNDVHHRLEIITEGAPSAEAELGLNAYGSSNPNSGAWDSTVNVFHQHEISIDISDMDLVTIAGALQNAINSETVNGASIGGFTFDTSAGTLRHAVLSNGSIYDINFSCPTNAISEVLGFSGLTRDAAGNGSNLYHNHTISNIDVGNRTIDQIRQQLNNSLQATLNLDGLANPVSMPFIDHDNTDGTHSIWIKNVGAGATCYQLTVNDNTGVTASELGINGHIVNRDSTDHTGIARDYAKSLGTVLKGSSIEDALATFNTWGIIAANWVNADHTPGYDGFHHIGQISLTNTEDKLTRREVVILDSVGAYNLFGVIGDVTLSAGNSINTREWYARDRVHVRTDYSGVANDGTPHSLAIRYDWWWEGDDGSTNPLVSDPNLPFDSIYIPDTDDHSTELSGSWCMYTHARAANNHDRIDVELYRDDMIVGNAFVPTDGLRFNDGVLDDRSDILMPQMIRTGAGAYSIINHDIDFGTISTCVDAVRYSERYAAGTYDWYAHAYYGDDATYYFDKGGNWSDYIKSVKVWSQEDDNASLLFKVIKTGPPSVLEVEGKGYNRNGTANDFGPITITLTGGPVQIGCIMFDELQLGSGLTVNDKFVINVSARAGGGYHKDNPDQSDANISVTGNPWNICNNSMHYRFDENAENGKTFDLLGYFVHPLFGGDNDIGVWTGNLVMNVTGSGFKAGTRVGTYPNIHAEINYQGRTDHTAAALLTGYYFQEMVRGEATENFIPQIKYDPNETQNASVMFEVIQTEGGIVLRGQAHIYDKNSDYRYAYDDYISLNSINSNITVFNDCGCDGLTFSNFDLNTSRLKAGDRFCISLSANAEPSTSDNDEVYLFSQAYNRDIYPHSWRFNDGVIDYNTTKLRTYQIDYNNGDVYDSVLSMNFVDFHGGTAMGVEGSNTTPRKVKETATFTSIYEQSIDMGPANHYSKLKDISNFWTTEGRFLFDTPQQIKIIQGENETTITLYGNEEVVDVLDKINHAIYQGLAQEKYVTADNRFKFASFVDSPSIHSPLETSEGTIVMRSVVAGEEGELTFVGNEGLLKALGINIIRKATDNVLTVNVRDVVTGKEIAKDVNVDGSGQVLGINGNIELSVAPSLLIKGATYNDVNEDFTLIEQKRREFIHVTDKTPVLHVGANMNNNLRLVMGNVSRKGLRLDNLLVMTREQANKAITKIDRAIDKVSSQRVNLGAYQNRLEHNLSRLSISAENLASSESRIRDADIAKEMVQYIKYNLVNQANITVQLLANQAPGLVLKLLG